MFYDYLVTNESLDVILPGLNTKIIDILGSVREQALANAAGHLAINVMLFTQDDCLVVPRRGFLNAENPGEYGPSLSGSIPIKEDLFYSDKKANARLIEPLPHGLRRISFEAAVKDMVDAELSEGLRIYDLKFIAFAVGKRLGCPALIATARTDIKSADFPHILGRWETEGKLLKLLPFERDQVLSFLGKREIDGIRRVPYLEFGIRMAFYQRYGEQFLRNLPIVGRFSVTKKI